MKILKTVAVKQNRCEVVSHYESEQFSSKIMDRCIKKFTEQGPNMISVRFVNCANDDTQFFQSSHDH